MGYRSSFCASCGGLLLKSDAECVRCTSADGARYARTPRGSGARVPSTLRQSSNGPSTQLDGQGPQPSTQAPPEPTLSQQAPPSVPLDTQLSAEDFFSLDPEEVPEAAAPILAGFLVCFANRLGHYWPLTQGKNRIGRRGTRRDAEPTILVDEPTVSLEHAIIHASASPGRMKLEDLGSRNGTYVDGLRILPGQKIELRDGQLLTLGEFRAIVKIV